MSWKERIDIPFKIVTGDGITYTPLLSQENSLSIDMLASAFEFSGIDGSLVKRKATSGRTFSLIFFFVGDNHLNHSDNFIESAKNKKPWTVSHPKYRELYVQPISIKREDSNFNKTGFSVEVQETIKQSYPNSLRSKTDSIRTLSDNATIAGGNAFDIAVSSISAEDESLMAGSINNTHEQYSQDIRTAEDATDLQNSYQKALTAISSLDISTVQAFVTTPVNSASSVTSRLSQLIRAYNQISDLSTFSLKEYFQAIGASIIAGMCLSSINPNKGDYSKRKNVAIVTAIIKDTYANYLNTLDSIQDENLSLAEAFNADANVIKAVDRAVKETIANLNEVVFGALVENTYKAPYPTNLILLTHYLLGGVTDKSITELIEANDFNRDELVYIKKGREVVYYA